MICDLDLNLGLGYMAYRCASLINIQAKFHSNRKKRFVDKCKYV